MCIMHSMKILIITMGILVMIIFSGILSLEDAHRVYGLLSLWNVHVQKIVTVFIGLSIIGYATLYIFYACKRTDKPTSR